ncbi:unnamed protein product [Prunus armeniaca]|uniref:Uncharacterized protein n=1 Tax=Prunus armeniaca TaxID=36596 RepID=A0A6J5WJD2_PRUAR|nr:unnamed protein product [Prunus armeniaca]
MINQTGRNFTTRGGDRFIVPAPGAGQIQETSGRLAEVCRGQQLLWGKHALGSASGTENQHFVTRELNDENDFAKPCCSGTMSQTKVGRGVNRGYDLKLRTYLIVFQIQNSGIERYGAVVKLQNGSGSGSFRGFVHGRGDIWWLANCSMGFLRCPSLRSL